MRTVQPLFFRTDECARQMPTESSLGGISNDKKPEVAGPWTSSHFSRPCLACYIIRGVNARLRIKKIAFIRHILQLLPTGARKKRIQPLLLSREPESELPTLNRWTRDAHPELCTAGVHRIGSHSALSEQDVGRSCTLSSTHRAICSMMSLFTLHPRPPWNGPATERTSLTSGG